MSDALPPPLSFPIITKGFLALSAAALAGTAASWLSLPLAWMLGPMLASAGFALSGVRVVPPVPVLRIGQICLGASIGLNMSAAALASLIDWIPLIIVTALFSIVIAAVLSVLLSRLSGIDAHTAYFASLPGGLVEMSNIGAQVGASPEPIAVVQALRVAMVVLIIPASLVGLGITSGAPAVTQPFLKFLWVPAVAAAAAVGARVAILVRLNNPWILGPMIVAASLTVSELLVGRMPISVFSGAQFIVGFTLGARFQRSIVRKLPMVAMIGACSTVFFSAVLACYATLLSRLTGLDLATAILCTSIGGASEMAVTAQVLHLDVSLVVAFHLIRAVMVNGFATYYWSAFSRLGLFRLINRIMTGGGSS